ncbi:MAG: hypothetical protein AB3X37_13290 [Leptothrix ochracea]|uniref:hypothetical protein n=1 Tax=Leptothrix ochracea TaxID=735331 RepID=UPI0034E1EDCC
MSSTDVTPQALDHIGIRDLAILLVKHFGHHQGRFQVAIGFRVGVGQVHIGDPLPGVMVGIEGVMLAPVSEGIQGIDVVDAAEVNPEPKRKRKQAALIL